MATEVGHKLVVPVGERRRRKEQRREISSSDGGRVGANKILTSSTQLEPMPEQWELEDCAKKLMISVDDVFILSLAKRMRAKRERECLLSVTVQVVLHSIETTMTSDLIEEQVKAIWAKSSSNLEILAHVESRAEELYEQAVNEASSLWKDAVNKEEQENRRLVTPHMETQYVLNLQTSFVRGRDISFWRRATINKEEPSYSSAFEKFEVFQLIIDNGGHPIDLYGQVEADDEILYRRDCNNSEKISDPPCASLTGPSVCIVCAQFIGHIIIKVNLWNKITGDKIEKSIEIGGGDSDSDWTIGDVFNQPKVEKFTGTSSFSATLKYALFSCAEMAIVEVRLIYTGNNENRVPIAANVYGSIFSSIDMGGGGSNMLDENSERLTATQTMEGDFYLSDENSEMTATLFKKSRDESTLVEPYTAIPLSREALSVQYKSSLKVCTRLMNRSTDDSPDVEIVAGFIEFCPADYSDQCLVRKYVTGDYGEIQVRVNFY